MFYTTKQTNWYYKAEQVLQCGTIFMSKWGQVLQSRTTFITNWVSYYNVRQLLQSSAVQEANERNEGEQKIFVTDSLVQP